MRKNILVIITIPFILAFISLYLAPAFRGEIEVASGFTIGGFTIRYYGLTLALGVLAGWLVSSRLAQKLNLDARKFDNVLLVTVISGIAGSRLFVVAENLDYFVQNPAEIYKIWHGGLAIYGGLAGGLAGALIYAKRSKLHIWKTFDALATGAPLGQAIGRFGNFFNQEAFGPPTGLPWKMFVNAAHRPPPYLAEQFFHPTFLYETLWSLLVFVVLLSLAKQASRPGIVLGSYLIFYAAGRFFIEYLRLDSFLIYELRFNQLLSFFVFAAGLLIIFFSRKHAQAS